ncbi:MAG: amidase [Pseudomonadota bacterium]
MSNLDDAATASALTDRVLGNIERLQPEINAMLALCIDAARETAADLDAASQRGEWRGLLHGMPIAVKDNIDTAGIATTSGARFFADHVPNADAPVVQRLRRAGAVIVGKAMLHEFAFGIRSNNSVGGQCHNPWSHEHVPGGSSGGSAAALAADMCVGALGTDTGGSVRLPAAMCGVSGLRPTHGRIPNTGSTPVCPSQDTIGPMARRVSDVARLFAVMAGFDPGDPFSVDHPLENFLPGLDRTLEGVRIGVPRRTHFADADAAVEAAVLRAAQELEQLGATLTDIELPGFAAQHQQASVVIFADACAFHASRMRDQPERFDAQVLERMRVGLDLTAVQYADAMAARMRWRRELEGVFESVDALLSPTVHTPVPLIDDDKSLLAATRDATRNTYAGAFAQIPGLSVPCGFAGGLPVGMQLEGAWWSEPLLLRIGHAYQQATDWHLRRAPGV